MGERDRAWPIIAESCCLGLNRSCAMNGLTADVKEALRMPVHHQTPPFDGQPSRRRIAFDAALAARSDANISPA